MATFDYRDFSHVFGKARPFPNRDFFQETETVRRKFDGALFIDRVLKALGVGKAKIYPAKTENTLKALHQQVCEANMTMHHRLSIFYYVLLDFDYANKRSDYSEDFAAVSGVPKKYQIFMKGLWLLDRHEFKAALEYISHPSLMPDFADDIIIAFARHSDDPSLALSYFHTVQPVLKTPQALTLVFDAMADSSVAQAFHYSRTYPEHTRQLLFQRLITSVLDSPAGDEAGQRGLELISLALDADEEAWFEEYLTTDLAKHKRARDTLVMRRIVTGKLEEAVTQKGLGGQWASILEGMRQGLGNRA
ncbi:unnamed protein product [Parascedosporium putredinis]|uniref:ELYS-like domain-containing protein n=1 Tax=Parascedosporium putredinis TaxID=1442378 RepID=A0A9P1MCB9_9PEZI|nr:unnamed protein product [Parascedosporium putredinis]CAI7996249.1 unnamed protein product [Parascedosporium putredinis]